MERTVLILRSKEFNQDEYKNLLERLIESDSELAFRVIPQLALRSAMRTAPFLGGAGHLNCWPEEKRLEYLASVIRIIASPEGISSVNAAAGTALAVADNEAAAAYAYVVSAAADAAKNTAAAYAAAEAYDAAAVGNAAVQAAAAANFAANVAISAHSTYFVAAPSLLYEALRNDMQKAQESSVGFEAGSLWWGNVPEFFSENLRKLEGIVTQLPRSESDQEALSTINSALSILWREAGIARPAMSTSIIDSAENVSQQLNYLSTNQSHPENPATKDKLNRQKLVDALAINLTHSTNKHHRAIGLLGEWGSGKSTVLKLLKQKLKETHKEQPFVFGEFNAWAYEHSDNIQAGIAQEVLNAVTTLEFYEVPEKHKNEKRLAYWKRSIGSRILNTFWHPIRSFALRSWITFWYALRTQKLQLLKSVVVLFVALLPAMLASQKIDPDWFSWLGKLSNDNKTLLDNLIFQLIWGVGFGVYFLKEIRSLMANPLSKELLTYIRLPDYAKHLGDIPVMRDNIKVMCDIRLGRLCGKPKRMLFVVDDLDRCSPAAIVKVLEALRLVLDLEDVIVLIAIDQHIALAALSNHFKEFSPHHKLKNSHAIAREYLSKVINLPIVLTAPSDADVKEFMTDLWKDMPKVLPVGAGDPGQKVPVDNSPAPSSSEMNLPVVDSTLELDSVLVTDISPDSDHTERVKSKATEDDKQVTAKVNPINALSPEQQASFIYWANYFELTNPRQLKRLNNSYDLMRSYLPQWDKEVVEFALTEVDVLKVYPMLLTLILMEYLNSLHSLTERSQLWEKLFSEPVIAGFESAKVGIPRVKVTEINNKRVTSDFVKAYRSLLAAEGNKSLVSNVEAFVLPAMN